MVSDGRLTKILIAKKLLIWAVYTVNNTTILVYSGLLCDLIATEYASGNVGDQTMAAETTRYMRYFCRISYIAQYRRRVHLVTLD